MAGHAAARLQASTTCQSRCAVEAVASIASDSVHSVVARARFHSSRTALKSNGALTDLGALSKVELLSLLQISSHAALERLTGLEGIRGADLLRFVDNPRPPTCEIERLSALTGDADTEHVINSGNDDAAVCAP